MGQLSQRTAIRTDPAARAIGTLCVGGDWACAHGDLEALGDVAARLAAYVREALHGDLVALSTLVRRDPDRATAFWVQLRESLRPKPRTRARARTRTRVEPRKTTSAAR